MLLEIQSSAYLVLLVTRHSGVIISVCGDGGAEYAEYHAMEFLRAAKNVELHFASQIVSKPGFDPLGRKSAKQVGLFAYAVLHSNRKIQTLW